MRILYVTKSEVEQNGKLVEAGSNLDVLVASKSDLESIHRTEFRGAIFVCVIMENIKPDEISESAKATLQACLATSKGKILYI